MKKIGLIMGCFGVIVLLTGCGGSKSLECSMTNDNQTQTFYLNFGTDDLLQSGTFNYRIQLSEEEQAYLDDLMTELEDQFDSSEFEGVKVDVTNNGKDIVDVNMSFDADEMSEVLGQEIDDSVTYDYIKEDLEDSGYVCK